MCGGQYWLVHNFEIKNYIAEIKSAPWEYSPLTVLDALRRLNGIHNNHPWLAEFWLTQQTECHYLPLRYNIHPWLAECWLTQQTECHADCGHWEAGVSHDPTLGLIKYCRDAHNRCWWLHWTHAESGPYPADTQCSPIRIIIWLFIWTWMRTDQWHWLLAFCY